MILTVELKFLAIRENKLWKSSALDGIQARVCIWKRFCFLPPPLGGVRGEAYLHLKNALHAFEFNLQNYFLLTWSSWLR